MRWDYGSVYKSIRKSKHLSQEQVWGDFLNRTTLVRFENNQTIPSYELMRFLLKQVDMTFEEFEYLCNYYQPSQRQQLLYDIDNLRNPTTKMMEDLINCCHDHLKKNPMIFLFTESAYSWRPLQLSEKVLLSPSFQTMLETFLNFYGLNQNNTITGIITILSWQVLSCHTCSHLMLSMILPNSSWKDQKKTGITSGFSQLYYHTFNHLLILSLNKNSTTSLLFLAPNSWTQPRKKNAMTNQPVPMSIQEQPKTSKN